MIPSVDQVQAEIARLKREAAALRKKLSDAQGDAAKASASAREKRAGAMRTSTPSMASGYLREAERLEKKAADLEKRAADAAKKIAENSSKQASKLKVLDSALRDAQRRQDREADRRRQTEKRHAQEVARLSQASVRYVHEIRVVEPPKPERLRVLFLAANPEQDLRVDVEVRSVRDAVKKALHRELIEIDHRPAATPDDLLDGINELRPHVIHFSGHGGGASLLFDDARVAREEEEQAGHTVSLDLLARALAATDTPPMLVVLNACDSLEGAEVLLRVAPVVIGMRSGVSDIGAEAFAARFYSAIASAQAVGAALEQARVAVEILGFDEGWTADALARDDIGLESLVLVRPTDSVDIAEADALTDLYDPLRRLWMHIAWLEAGLKEAEKNRLDAASQTDHLVRAANAFEQAWRRAEPRINRARFRGRFVFADWVTARDKWMRRHGVRGDRYDRKWYEITKEMRETLDSLKDALGETDPRVATWAPTHYPDSP